MFVPTSDSLPTDPPTCFLMYANRVCFSCAIGIPLSNLRSLVFLFRVLGQIYLFIYFFEFIRFLCLRANENSKQINKFFFLLDSSSPRVYESKTHLVAQCWHNFFSL